MSKKPDLLSYIPKADDPGDCDICLMSRGYSRRVARSALRRYARNLGAPSAGLSTLKRFADFADFEDPTADRALLLIHYGTEANA